MALIDFMSPLHRATRRDYLARVNDPEFPKARAARLAKQWGREYWDGDRRTGYGGMNYDGRWLPVAEAMARHYGLRGGDKVLDVGCGKGFLMHDLSRVVPGLEVHGIDVSDYARMNAKPEVRDRIQGADATRLPFEDDTFALVLSINTLHNLECMDMVRALREIQRVSARNSYVCVESWRGEEEKANLLYWQLTCESFFSPRAWEWWFRQAGYEGDYSFIYFE